MIYFIRTENYNATIMVVFLMKTKTYTNLLFIEYIFLSDQILKLILMENAKKQWKMYF